MIALEQNRRPFLLGLGSVGVSRPLVQGVPQLRPRRHRDMCSGLPKGNIFFIFATMATSISRSAKRQAPTVSPGDPASNGRAQAFRSTDICGWTKPSTSSKVAGVLTLNVIQSKSSSLEGLIAKRATESMGLRV